MDAQRALLDELMGSARNLTEDERRGFKEVKWDDKEVCAFYMVRFCPHDLFVNTRSDLGPCSKIHEAKLKESFGIDAAACFDRRLIVKHDLHILLDQKAFWDTGLLNDRSTSLYHVYYRFENSPRHDSYVPKFEAELAHFCEKLVMDLDKKVRRGRERLAQEVDVPPPPPISAEKSEQLSVLEEKIKNLLEQVESLGEAGKVDEAEALMRKVEMLNVEKTTLTQQSQQNSALMIVQEKKMALCETCGSFLVANDAAERTQSHVTGKQHVGYGMVRDFLAEYKAAKEKAREEERLAREKEAEERKKLREKEHDSRRRRSESSDRDKHKDQDHDRERDRYRGRDRDLDRNGRGGRDFDRGSGWKHGSSRNGRNRSRERYRGRDRSRSRSPIRHGSKRSRSPVHKY